MSKNLVIVESPAKAKTIQKYLGKGFQVESSYGHVADLSKRGMGIEIDNHFKPHYQVDPEKKGVVEKLKKLADQAETVWLASDEDREGEAIAWHLSEVLKIPPEKQKRIVFHEITKGAILRAVENPRSIDKNLVNAQQARRVLDRLVGFELSPILWKKVKYGLSAGRVQSVAVRLIVEREEAIRAFSPTAYFKVTAEFTSRAGECIKAEIARQLECEAEAQRLLERARGAAFSVEDIQTKPASRQPAAPFTTSTLQQEASRKLGFSVAQTMVNAQRLYEAGHITYMRTDSVNLSEEALKAASVAITSEFGAEYCETRRYKSKSKGAQEAHEAVRPTDLKRIRAGGENGQKRLYELIRKRSLASQMAAAKLEKTTLRIKNDRDEERFTARGEVVLFDGFLRLYVEGEDDKEDEQSGLLPKVSIGEALRAEAIWATQKFTRQPYRYSEASLVRKLEELGIGRPSTYAPTISTIQKRDYVARIDHLGTEKTHVLLSLEKGVLKRSTFKEVYGRDRGKLTPTDVGIVVNQFLVNHFEQVLGYGFTAKVEEEFDTIARGKEGWTEMIEHFYGDFHPKVQHVEENADRARGERQLGRDPKSGKPVYARIGRYGPMVQIGDAEDEEKPRFATIRKDQSLQDITLEQALTLFELPRVIGAFEEEPVKVNIGRFGPYLLHKSKFTSLGKEDDPYEIELARAIELIEAKRVDDANKYICEFNEEKPHISVLNGRYGHYIKMGRRNFKIPTEIDPASLTREKALEIIENQPKARIKRKTTKKK